jgi:cbb3-type cytochrome oxidase maturation protein
MVGHESAGHEVAHAAGGFLGRVIAIVVGIILMVAGIAMGVSLVLLPVGIPLGFVGLLAFLWGVFPRQRETPPTAGRSP